MASVHVDLAALAEVPETDSKAGAGADTAAPVPPVAAKYSAGAPAVSGHTSRVTPSGVGVTTEWDSKRSVEDAPAPADGGKDASSSGDEEDGAEYVTRDTLVSDMASYTRRGKHTIDPRSNKLHYWDCVMVVCLGVVAIFTPFDIIFFANGNVDAGVLVVNRLLDILFISDMVLQCFVRRRDSQGNWLVNESEIARLYVSSKWFCIDLIGVIPFDWLVRLALNDTTDGMGSLRVFRLVRLLRLFKLLRVVRASRIITRWEARLPVTYATLHLTKFVVIVVILCHWTANAWGLAALIAPEDTLSWPERYDMDDAGVSTLYLSCLYFSVMTVATIGYGDIVPQNDYERVVAVILMIVGGMGWAFVIGSVSGIMTNSDRATHHFQQRMDDLHRYAASVGLRSDLRARLQAFFHFSRSRAHDQYAHDLLMFMSPALRAEVALHQHGKWIISVPFFKGNSSEQVEFTTAVVTSLVHRAYAPYEVVFAEGDRVTGMYFVSKGVVVNTQCRISHTGDHVGEDVVLRHGRRTTTVSCIIMTSLLELTKADLNRILYEGDFPVIRLVMRWAAIQLSLARRLHYAAAARTVARRMLARAQIDPSVGFAKDPVALAAMLSRAETFGSAADLAAFSSVRSVARVIESMESNSPVKALRDMAVPFRVARQFDEVELVDMFAAALDGFDVSACLDLTTDHEGMPLRKDDMEEAVAQKVVGELQRLSKRRQSVAKASGDLPTQLRRRAPAVLAFMRGVHKHRQARRAMLPELNQETGQRVDEAGNPIPVTNEDLMSGLVNLTSAVRVLVAKVTHIEAAQTEMRAMAAVMS